MLDAAWKVVPLLLLACGGGVAAGWALARLQILLVGRLRDIPISVLLQFVGTFAVWLIADRLGLSPLITMVAFAMTLPAPRPRGRRCASGPIRANAGP